MMFLDQMNRLGATYFWKSFRKNETNEKFSQFLENVSNFFFDRNFRTIFGTTVVAYSTDPDLKLRIVEP